MIKYGLSNRYKVDPYGTEEILSNASVSLAPKLTIDYGDEVQEAEFTIRPTKGSLDTNISPVAVLNAIKGNTVVWNQLIQNGDFANTDNWSATLGTMSANGNVMTLTLSYNSNSARIQQSLTTISGHKYYLSCYFNTSKSASCSVRTNASVSNKVLGNLTTTANTWNRMSSIWACSANGSILYFYCNLGQTLGSGDTSMFKEVMLFDLTIIYGSGNEPTTVAEFEADYYKWFGKQLTYEEYDTGSLRSCKMNGIKTTDGNSNLLGITSIPIISLKGKLGGQGSSVLVFADGIKSAGNARDEIKIENGVAKAIKRVGTRAYEFGDVNSSTMTTDEVAYTNYALATPEEYILDEWDVEKIMLGSTEITKVYLGNQLIFEESN